MKLVQYWISRELSSFSLFRWVSVGTSFKDDSKDGHLNQILCWVVKRPGTHQELYFITLEHEYEKLPSYFDNIWLTDGLLVIW